MTFFLQRNKRSTSAKSNYRKKTPSSPCSWKEESVQKHDQLQRERRRDTPFLQESKSLTEGNTDKGKLYDTLPVE